MRVWMAGVSGSVFLILGRRNGPDWSDISVVGDELNCLCYLGSGYVSEMRMDCGLMCGW